MTDIPKEQLRLLSRRLRLLNRPLIQETDLAICFLLALQDSDAAAFRKKIPELKKAYRDSRAALLELGVIEVFQEAKQQHGYLVGMASIDHAEQALCSIDPFAYVSHLCAMAWHGLTDRIPNTLYLTRPSAGLWKQLSDHLLEKELGGLQSVFISARFPGYQRLAIQKLQNRPLNIWSSSRLDQAWQAAYKKVDNGRVRVATVGRCFLDMVREPKLCGGIYHVIKVFEEHGITHVDQILNEIDRHANKLEQARTGYLLEQADPQLASNPVLERWAAEVTRGGSRKLDPSAEYADTFSERWALSINV